MSKKNQNEFREFPRLPKEVAVEVSELTYPMPTERGEVVKSVDISALGIRFISATPFKPGAVLTVNIHLAGWQRHKKNLSVLLDDANLKVPILFKHRESVVSVRPGIQYGQNATTQ